MSTITKRTKLIIGAVLTVSLACNFFFLGWLAGASPLIPGPLGSFLRPPPAANQPPELHFIEFLTRGLSESARHKIFAAVESHALDIRNLERQSSEIRADIVALMLKPELDRPTIEKRIHEYEQTMRRRVSTVSQSVLSVLLGLGMEDRRIFMENWARGPGAPPPPPSSG